jgi:Galactose oxidase, central domain/Kelch motif
MAKISFTALKPSPDEKFGSPCSRSSHGLSLVQNGTRLILHGGEHIARTPLEDNEATWAADLDENTWQWRRILSDNIPSARVAHAQAVCNDRVYVFGGRAGIAMEEKATNDLWELDASGTRGTETWTLVEPDKTSGPPPEPRSFHRMVAVSNSLYVFGGCGANGRLADLHRFDLENKTWHDLGPSPLLRGRGGANLLTLSSSTSLGVVAGFCGEETADGHRFDIATNQWDEKSLTESLQGMRPRSVCVCGSFPSVGFSVIFGGEVDPSERGHEGAGGFENDVVLLQEDSGKYVETLKAARSAPWPEARGWSDAASLDDGNGKGLLFIFGGLSGDDANPRRLDDLWRLEIQAS